MAEAAFKREAQRLSLEVRVDSAGTGDWHIGKPPDPRAQAETMRHGIDISGYRARQAAPDDFHTFTHIFALDHDNLADLGSIAPPGGSARLSLLLDHVAGLEGQSVADPYFGGDEGFAETWKQVSRAAQALVDLCKT